MSGREGRAGFVGDALSLSWMEPALAWATFTRPKTMNTITLAFIAELSRALDEAEAGDARALVLTGEGRAFCGGAELTYFTDPDSPIGQGARAIRRYVEPIARLFTRLETSAVPTIAAINGYAFGGGCELALACDLRVMADTAAIGLTEVRVGAVPGAGGIGRLQRLLGRGRASELILLARRLSADEALRIGLAMEVVRPDALIDRAREIAAALQRTSPAALAEAKRCLAACESLGSAASDELCLDAVERLAAGPEWREGMTAFVEKRAPRY